MTSQENAYKHSRLILTCVLIGTCLFMAVPAYTAQPESEGTLILAQTHPSTNHIPVKSHKHKIKKVRKVAPEPPPIESLPQHAVREAAKRNKHKVKVHLPSQSAKAGPLITRLPRGEVGS